MQVGDHPNCLEQCLWRGVANADHQIYPVELPDSNPAMWHRFMRNVAPGMAYSAANTLLAAEVNRFQPDVLWLFKGMTIYPSTVRRLRESGVTLVNFNADHPFRYFSRGSGNNNVLKASSEYHLHLTYSHRIADEIHLRCPHSSVGVVPFGHEVDDDTFQRINTADEIPRACFVGNPDDHRRRNILSLIHARIPVDVYGDRWERFLQPSQLLRVNGMIEGDAMLQTLRRYRLQLNFFRPHNEGSHNMRTFEVPASGGIMLAEDSPEHRSFFVSRLEAFYFRSPAEMIEAARHILTMDKGEAQAVRRAARARSVNSGYTYRDRADQAIGEISSLLSRRRSGLR